jgi:hypothetical protein
MSTYARLSENLVLEILVVQDGFTIEQTVAPELVSSFIVCPGDTVPNSTYDSETGVFTPPPPAPQTWNDYSVRYGLTLSDKTRWDNNQTPEIITVKIEFETPQERPYTTELLQYLVDTSSISQLSMDQVLAESPSVSAAEE